MQYHPVDFHLILAPGSDAAVQAARGRGQRRVRWRHSDEARAAPVRKGGRGSDGGPIGRGGRGGCAAPWRQRRRREAASVRGRRQRGTQQTERRAGGDPGGAPSGRSPVSLCAKRKTLVESSKGFRKVRDRHWENASLRILAILGLAGRRSDVGRRLGPQLVHRL
jgi:hypothetical protein